ncbi:MAG TPA: anthranilate phosphoribosyltransferase [Thermoanaerobaculia bacterium]|nr:anthranilate phosphoribosyltransferase [Thermoanaerobaculia bacterium]
MSAPATGGALDARQALARWMSGGSLSHGETEDLFGQLMDGAVPDTLKSALLVALAMKGESEEEIAGAASAMRRRVVAIPHSRPEVVDTCGTGGDGKGGFNVSTAAAFVVAGAGAPVAKHGNRSVSSRSGSADVLAALGVPLDVTPETAARSIDEIGIAFLFAPRLHPAMAAVAPVRRELAVRTVFNLLGPLTNPAGARRQVIGVYAEARVEPVARVLARLGCEHALVVHGSDGFDEITTTGPTLVTEVRGGEVRSYQLEPLELGVARARPEELAGGDAEDNARRLLALLEGEPGPLADMVAVNAGAALYVAGLAASLAEGLALARATLACGAARAKLQALRTFRGGPA